jgi:SulP family sulfate permease
MSTNIVMIATVGVVVATHNLAIGVFVGVLLASLFFANKVGQYMAISSSKDDATATRTYTVTGQVFFTSAEKFIASFDFKEVLDKVVIDLSQAHFWDITAVGSLDKVVIKFRREGVDVDVIGLNEASRTIVDKQAIHDKPEEVEKFMAGH